MNEKVGVFLNGVVCYPKYNIGDRVETGEGNVHVVEEIRVYPYTEYIFTYWLFPSMGHDVPEDELEEI